MNREGCNRVGDRRPHGGGAEHHVRARRMLAVAGAPRGVRVLPPGYPAVGGLHAGHRVLYGAVQRELVKCELAHPAEEEDGGGPPDIVARLMFGR